MLLRKLVFLLLIDGSFPHSELMGTYRRFRNSLRGVFQRGVPYQDPIKLLTKFNCNILPERGRAAIREGQCSNTCQV